MRVGSLCEQGHIVVLGKVVCILVEPPRFGLLGSEGCRLLEVLLLLKLLEFLFLRLVLRWENLVIAQEANLLELPAVRYRGVGLIPDLLGRELL